MAGIFRNKEKVLQDMLDESLRKNSDLGRKLKESEKERQELQEFFDFICGMTQQKGWQLYGLENFKGERIVYFLKGSYEQDPQYVYDYELRAYLSGNLRTPVYQAQLEWRFDSRFDVKRRLYISSQVVGEPSLRGKGIGTKSFALIKDLAEELQCDSINGLRHPLCSPDIEDEREKNGLLYRFYERLGFVQADDTDEIVYRLRD